MVAVGFIIAAFLALPRGLAPLRRSQTPVGAITKHVNSAAGPEAPESRAPAQGQPSVTPAQWTAKFHSSQDYRDFVVDALPRAMSGDGRAAWYIGQAVVSCVLVTREYHRGVDPQAQIRQQLDNMVKAPQWIRDLGAERTNRCASLAKNDPFGGLPQREGGYSSAYWYELALADKDPLAEEHAAAEAVATITVTKDLSEDAKALQLRIVNTNVRESVESADPDALFYAGTLLSDPRYSNDPLNGIAVAPAACDLGHDCSADNPENPFYNCKLSGECPSSADYAYFLQKSLGPDRYSQIYAHAQEIEQSVRSGEWDAVLKNLIVDKTPQ